MPLYSSVVNLVWFPHMVNKASLRYERTLSLIRIGHMDSPRDKIGWRL